VAEPAHQIIAAYLDIVLRGDLPRLMIFAPPQHGKSELSSVRLPAYWLGRRPDDPIILASYAASLAEDKSRQARETVESLEYRRLFPAIATQPGGRTVSHWHLDGRRGSMLAVGVGGPVTGHGGRLGIIDDPVENWEQAQSQVLRDKTWEWWRTTFRTRIWEGGAIILIMTRWHEDDLAGRMLQDQPGEWTILRLPAIAETQEERDANDARLGQATGQPDPLERRPGQPLCPGRFSREALEALRRDVGSLAWAGQYQGVPRAPEGNRFKRAWFAIVDIAPMQAARVRYWDQAGTAGGGAYTAGVLIARGHDGLFYIEDVVRGRWSPGQRDEVIKQTAELDRLKHHNTVHQWFEQEPGSAGKESAEAKVRLLAGFPVHTEHATGSKEVRAEPLAAQAEAGNVRLVRGAWNGAFLEEICAFPNSTYKDQVDGTTGAFNKLAGQPAGPISRPFAAYVPPSHSNPFGFD
jgi:predicted phage terminase large subunit-like protein